MMAEEWLFFFVLQAEILTVLVHARIVFWAAHTIHAPLQVPKPWYDKYAHINDDERRRKYLAMVMGNPQSTNRLLVSMEHPCSTGLLPLDEVQF